ncbi:MAG: lysylphosphatidylglycerol synthase transmembrane domain-containing protein, partial [Acidimicrobiales bacterium]
MPEEDKPRLRSRWRAAVPAPLRHGILIFLVVIVVEYLVVPELIGASKNIHYLEKLNVGWLVAGVGFEAASLFTYGLLTWTLLPHHRPSVSRVFRIDLATTAVAHTVPGGTAASAGLGYRLLTSDGISGTDAGFTMATQGIGSAVVLNVMLWFALVISIPIAGFHTIYIVVALAGMLALLFFAVLVYLLTRGEEPASRFVRRVGQALPWVQPDRLETTIRHIGDSLRTLANNRDRLRSALVWATGNWLLDAAALWSFLAALGRYVNPIELFAAYGIANVLAAIPITPGGLGFVEASLPLLLASFGLTKNVALLSVLGWRIVNFWLPIP